MTTIENNNNTNDDDIVAIIDGKVYKKSRKGRPRNPLRWKENGKYNAGYLDDERRKEYNKKYKEIEICEFCGKECQIMHLKRHQTSRKCSLMEELKATKEKLDYLESSINTITI